MMWIIYMRNLLLNPENKNCTYLLLVGAIAKTSDCSFGKNPCSYFPWPIFISSRWGWMAVWSIFIRRCSTDWAAGDSHRWTAAPPPTPGHAPSQWQWSYSDPWKPTRKLNNDLRQRNLPVTEVRRHLWCRFFNFAFSFFTQHNEHWCKQVSC